MGVGVLVVAPATARETATPQPALVALAWSHAHGASLVSLDPRSLRPIPGRRIPLYTSAGEWAFSPDRSVLALATSCRLGLGLDAGILFVDLVRFRPIGCMWVGGVTAMTWPEPRRLLAVASTGALSIDPLRRQVVARSQIEGGLLVETAEAGRELVLLLWWGGRGRIVVVDAHAGVRTVDIELALDAQPRGATPLRPGLAVDVPGRRAFVIQADGPVVEVSLGTLRVEFHELREQRSLQGVLGGAARAKSLPGTARKAAWTGHGTIAVSGGGTGTGPDDPPGLTLIDTRTWSVRTIDRGADFFALSGGRLVATGGPWFGLAVFDSNGRLLYRRFRVSTSCRVPLIHRGRVYAQVSGERQLRVVELATGRQLGSRASSLPTLLLDPSR